MGKAITIEQSHNAMGILANNVDWSSLDTETLQRLIDDPKAAGTQFTAFLKNGGRVVVGEPKVIQVDRSKPFDAIAFIGKGWSIDEQQDQRSLALSEIDITAVEFKTMLDGREASVKGEEKLKRLKRAGHIRLDAKVFQTLWENKHLIPEHWKEKTNGQVTHIFFDGTILRNPVGIRLVLCLCWRGGQWRWDFSWLDYDWLASNPSAVLAS